MFFTKTFAFYSVKYLNGILLMFTLVFLKCANYSTDFGTTRTKKQTEILRRRNG